MQAANITTAFERAALPISPVQAGLFAHYHALLLKWNSKANLLSKKDEARILERHFLESATLSHSFSGGESVLDLGCGAGFPGVPLKIMLPELSLTLLDSKRRKGLFLNNLVEELNLTQTTVVCDRAELAAGQPALRKAIDVVVCRAVARLCELIGLSSPFLKPDGSLLAIKGSAFESEIEEARKARPGLEFDVQPLPGANLEASRNLRVVRVKNI